MQITLTMPKLSPTMTNGVVVKWHKSQGEFVEANQLLLEIATDKATVEYQSLDSGWLRKILVQNGDEARVNQPIAYLTETKEEAVQEPPKTKETPPNTSAASSSDLKDDRVEEKTNKEPSAANHIAISQPAFVPEAPLEQYQFSRPQNAGRLKVSPLARKLAKKGGLDLSNIKGTGPEGRVTSRDLKGAPAGRNVAFHSREKPRVIPGSYEEKPLSPIRKIVAQRLQEAKSFIPHFYVSIKVNVQPLIDIRQQLKKQNIELTYNDFMIKAAAIALKKHPNMNSGFNSVNNAIVRFKSIDISVAVSLQDGLITPIIRHANFKNVDEISMEIKELISRAKEGKLSSEEYKGGSFTISNLGMYGVSEFIAILNPPQAAILAIGGMLAVPVVSNGAIVPGMEMTVTLSCDHRVIDGVDAAQFLATFKGIVESPAVLLV